MVATASTSSPDKRGQHDHIIIGRNEIAVQQMIKVFAHELGVALA